MAGFDQLLAENAISPAIKPNKTANPKRRITERQLFGISGMIIPFSFSSYVVQIDLGSRGTDLCDDPVQLFCDVIKAQLHNFGKD